MPAATRASGTNPIARIFLLVSYTPERDSPLRDVRDSTQSDVGRSPIDPTPVRTVAYSSMSCMLARVLQFRTNRSRSMAYTWLILGMTAAVAVLTAGQIFLRWRRFRGVRVVTC